MAKQRGIHQIKGKINNLCYYEQKYVRGGLIRRINEAMSERLKTDPVFANTRRANIIFGGCSMMAGLILDFFGDRNTFLFKPYRQALLTKAISKYLLFSDSSSLFPGIIERGSGIFYLPNIINSIIKNSIFNSFPELQNQYYNLSLNDNVDFTFNFESLVSFCKKNKCIGVQLSITRAHYLYNASYSDKTKEYLIPENNIGGRGSHVNWYLNKDDSSVVISSNTGDIDDATTFWIAYASPILYTVGNRPILGQTGASCGMITFLAT